jgi:sulfur-oxidizing protein SoxY
MERGTENKPVLAPAASRQVAEMPNWKRRTFNAGVFRIGLAVIIAKLMALSPARALADWPKTAFDEKSLPGALNAVFGKLPITPSNAISIDLPDIAEDGAIVPMKVTTSLPEVDSIAILAEKNPVPLIGQFSFVAEVEPAIKTRIKLAATGPVTVVARSQNKLYSATRQIKVVKGGCGVTN